MMRHIDHIVPCIIYFSARRIIANKPYTRLAIILSLIGRAVVGATLDECMMVIHQPFLDLPRPSIVREVIQVSFP